MKALNLLPLAICLCLISCNEAKTGTSPKADEGKSLTEKIVYNPLTLHYELEQGDLNPAETRSSTDGSSEEIRSHLEKGNAIVDSILNEAMNDPTKKFITVTSGQNTQAVQFQRKENGEWRKSVKTRGLSTFADDSLGITEPTEPEDTIIIHYHIPAGTLNNGSYAYEFAPIFMTGYHCLFIATAPAAYHVVTTDYFGGKNISSAIGIVADTDVPIAASNTKGMIEYRSTDSNKATCTYSGFPEKPQE